MLCWVSVTLTGRAQPCRQGRRPSARVGDMEIRLTMVSSRICISHLVPATVEGVAAARRSGMEICFDAPAVLCQRRGRVRVAIEPLTLETYFFNRCAQALALADAVSPDCGVCLDAYHLNMEETNIHDAIRLAGKRLFDFHVADNNRFAAGLGHLDWAKIVGTLREIGYDGALTNEFVAPVDRTPAAPYPDMVEKNPVDISPEQLKSPGPAQACDREVLCRQMRITRNDPAVTSERRRAPDIAAPQEGNFSECGSNRFSLVGAYPDRGIAQHVSAAVACAFDAAICGRDEDGIVGWGEGKMPRQCGEYAALVISEPRIRADPDRPRRQPDHRDLEDLSTAVGAKHPPRGASVAGTCPTGLTIAAISAIDIAVWDISARRDHPIWASWRQAAVGFGLCSGGWPMPGDLRAVAILYDAGGFRAV